MAILHKKEEKIQAVLGRLPQKYTDDQFVEMFIKLYSKDWGKIKSAYIKQSQDKEVGTVISMPKPAEYLKQVLSIYLQNTPPTLAEEAIPTPKPVAPKKAVSEVQAEAETKPAKKAAAKKTTEQVEKPKTSKKVEADAVEKPVKKTVTKKAKATDADTETDQTTAAVKKTAKNKN